MGEEVRVCYVVTVSFYLTCFSGFSLQISSKGQLEKKEKEKTKTLSDSISRVFDLTF